MAKLFTGFHETMYGSLEDLVDKKSKRFDFTVTAKAPIEKFLNPLNPEFMVVSLEGYVEMATADHQQKAEIKEGTLIIDFFKKKKLIYDFKFEYQNSKYLFHGEKLLDKKHPLKSMTTLYGTLYQEKNCKCDHCKDCNPITIGQTLSYFRLRDLPAFLVSLLKQTKRE